MTNNVEHVETTLVSPPASEAVSPSCYRVSVLSGSLEVSARLRNADDLDLLLRVLEANKVLFTKTDRSATDLVSKVTKTSTNGYGSDTETSSPKRDQSGTNTKRLTQTLTP
jgi:hypothetical protein